ncbi:modification methylase, HemK family [Beutenbergia cavernae DSM 12333]|uniref:peptide chain release factor N(5)-glutamine methyltransferase n=1 Tax=Beutenbergia cavernae (strain ATCC BAA-8 / DSM 12333 / CCUG 43141 / JCM 11478 / NBRC 16432 / NCIMB 13614 / HKI 0122) TaxID=471853 RepID=C5C410_BEUC1|nr:putative protein N(5)-glutamine methyltransferase [Beutenbergia cavernae]ACQ79923.1 modification methylase, HemK family [Beutenbergia cavernae DSM 12333]
MPVPAPPVLVARLRSAGCVFAEEEAALLVEAASTPEELEALTARRIAGEPLEHVVGWALFAGRRIRVSPGVFVPRSRSELLAREAIRLTRPGAVVVDLCCGAGALAAAIADAVVGLELHAADLDPAAVRDARRTLDGVAQVHEGDLFAALPQHLRGRVDVLVANTPYVPTDELHLMPREAREHEAPLALDGGGDGLDVQRRIAADAAGWLTPGGHLLVEVSSRQAPTAAAIMASGGLDPRIVHDDDLDATVVVGTRR